MASEKATEGTAARDGAVRLLTAVLADRQMLGDALALLDRLAPPERARAQALATMVLRQLPRIDAVIDGLVDRRPPLRALNVLRVCAVEILADGIAAHGAVSAAVSVARRGNNGRMTGLVNAVGRKLAAMEPGMLDGLPVPQIPKAIRNAVAGAFGEEATAGIEAAHLQRPPVDLTLRVPAQAEHWAGELGALVLPTGSLRLAQAGQISTLPGFEDGAWWVQDAAAAVPVRLLGDVAGKRVLDLCAAPGGKTLQLASAGAQVVALDISDDRLARLRENLTRTGLSAEVVAADALTWEPEAPFDAILLDAPCSATGTIRRHPDLPHVRPSLDLRPLMELQAALLRRAAGWLVPGGRMVFATCSIIPAEGERQMSRALDAMPELRAGAVDLAGLGLSSDWSAGAGALRLRPDYWAETGGMDGFFAALLERRA